MVALENFFYHLLFDTLHNEKMSALLATLIMGGILIIIAYLSLIISRLVILKIARNLAKRTTSEWDDIFLKHKTFTGIAHLIPATIIYFASNYANEYYPILQAYIIKTSNIYLLIASLYIITATLNSLNEIYNTSFARAKERPIAGFMQLVKIIVYFIGFLAFIAILFNKELGKLFTGLGAMAAILMLVFKDTILGFVASIQIMMNDMVKIGDWIEMKTRGADGTVIEINLTTVKVQNGDKTISMIPTYALISESFSNWRGVDESDGRRIKRSLNIDMNTVRFCNKDMIDNFQKIPLLKDFIFQKQEEIQTFNHENPEQFNVKKLTNIEVFRKYIEIYLQTHPKINNEMTFVVRYLQPTETGIPVEIYVFSKEKALTDYEAIQSDIFEHLIAIVPEFGLKIFQNISGNDITKMVLEGIK